MPPRLLRWSCTAACLAFAVPAAQAHPHVWTTMRTAVLAADGKITGVGLIWTFDETYTGYALEGLDLNKNGTFEASEIQPLTDENIKALEESAYFTSVRQAGKALSFGPVTQYEQTLDNGKLTLTFVLPLKEAADPRAGLVQIKVYDPDFFIAFDYAPSQPSALEGSLPQGCRMELKPLPTTEQLEQTRSFLSSKGQDWTNDTGEDFGAMFAQALEVSCVS